MKTFRIFLLILIVVGVILLFTQKIWVPKIVDTILEKEGFSANLVQQELTTYQSGKLGFEVKYPAKWQVRILSETGPWDFQSVPFSKNLHGVGIPPFGNMWVTITKGVCNEPSDGFVDEGSKPELLYKTACRENYQISLGLWQADPELAEHKLILNEILESFSVPSN